MYPSRRAALFAAAVTIVLGLTNTVAAQSPDREAAREELVARLENARAHLQLTDEQVPRVEAILRESAEQRRAIAARYRVGERKLKLREARKLKAELDGVDRATRTALQSVLTPAQLREYEKLQTELRNEVRARAKERR